MIEIGQNSGSAACKKSPRRRMYQDAKFTTLLHPSNAPKLLSSCLEQSTGNGVKIFETNNFFCSSSSDDQISQKVIEKNVFVDYKKRFEKTRIPIPVRPVETKNSNHEKSETTKKISKESNLETPASSAHDEKSNSKTSIFHKFLYNNEQKQVGSDLSKNPLDCQNNVNSAHCMAAENCRQPRPRSERRHTATGTNGLTMKEIQEWVSKEKQQQNNSITKDDSAIIIPAKMLPMRKAKTFSSFDWYERRNGNVDDEKCNHRVEVTHGWLHQLEKKKGRSHSLKLFDDDNAEKNVKNIAYNFAANQESNRQIPLLDGSQFTAGSTNDKTKSTNEDRILRNGINNRLSCFLSPRPYLKDSVRLNIMAQPRKSWNCYDDTMQNRENGIHSDMERSKNVPAATSAAYTTFIPDDDDDELISRAFPLRSPRSRTKYDTFLDLSNLELDDESVTIPNGNGSSLSSNSELKKNENWIWDDDDDDDLRRDRATSFDLHSSFFNDYDDELSQTSARGPLEKIDEHPTEIDAVDDVQAYQVSETETTTSGSKSDADIYDLPSSNNSTTDTASQSNTAETHTTSTSNSCIITSTSPTDAEHQSNEESVNLCKEEQDHTSHVISPRTVYTNFSCDVRNSSMSNETSLSCGGSSKTTDSQESIDTDCSDVSQEYNLCEQEFYGTHSVCDKTASLDRYTFRRKTDREITRAISIEDQEKTTQRTEGPESLREKSNFHMGLNRFYHVVISTVKNSVNGAKIQDVLDFVEAKGIRLTDPRLQVTVKRIQEEISGAETPLNIEVFSRVFEPSYNFIRSLLLSQVTIPGFAVFKMRISRAFEKLQEIVNQNDDSLNLDPFSSYNIMLKQLRSNKPVISMSICTVDGQRCTYGAEDLPHPLNACATVFNYCLACRQNSVAAVSYFLGDETKPPKKSEFMLEESEKVWNPFTKCGSVLTSALLFREMAMTDRLNALHDFYKSLIGNESLCCDNLSYNYKRIYDHEEIGLAYFLSATQRLPRGTAADLTEFLDFHFQAASSAMTSDACAIGAATLANGGVCPLTGASVLDECSVKHALDVMRKSYEINKSRKKQKTEHENLAKIKNQLSFEEASSPISDSIKSYDLRRSSVLILADGIQPLSNSCNDPMIRADNISAAWNNNGSAMIVIPGVLGISCFLHCHSSNAVEDIVKFLMQDLSSNFNFGVYKSLKKRRDLMKQ